MRVTSGLAHTKMPWECWWVDTGRHPAHLDYRVAVIVGPWLDIVPES